MVAPKPMSPVHSASTRYGRLEQLQDALGVSGQAFQRLVGGGRIDDLHHLHLVELVLTDHAAGIAPGGTGLAAEARGMGDELQRQLLGVEDLPGDDVGQRNLGGRDQVEVGFAVAADLEQVLLELRQLAGALQRRSLDEIGVGLLVAMLGGMQVDHELRQGAMQAGDRAAHEGEARAGKLGGGLEIQPAVPFTEGDMVLTSKSKVFGVPQRRTSTLASSSAPTGTDSCGRLGMPSSMASSSPWIASSGACLPPVRSPCGRHRPAAARCPRHAAWPGRSPWNARCARPAVAQYGSVPTCAALPALRCARHPVGSHGWPGGQPLLAAGCVPVWDRACSFLVSCRLSAVRGPVGASPAPATSSTPSRKPG